ncbi:MAG: glycosyltransferase [Bacteroidales bacterium]|nr:glycosyltransferase [Bacteroidales bacterium]
MNILFITNKKINPIIGGIERSTETLASALSKSYGHKCHSAYTQRIEAEPWAYGKEYLLSKGQESNQLTKIIHDANIDVIIAQGSDDAVTRLVKNIRHSSNSKKGCTFIYSFRGMPGFEIANPLPKVLFFRLIHRQNTVQNIKNLAIGILNPIAHKLFILFLRKKYRPAYDNADKVVLLSNRYIDDYAKYAGVKNDGRICSINNSLVFNNLFDFRNYDEIKRHEVLWVGRFNDQTKRFSEVLKAWQLIERTGKFNDWTLRIVGYGEDEKYFYHLVKKLNLKKVIYEGHSESLPYYKTASIFLMTSAYEGFGNVLTESLQNAVVPIAFDSYKALHDIIENGVNGFVSPNKNRKLFSERVMQVMTDSKLRKRLASNGLSSIEKFKIEHIASQWNNLIIDCTQRNLLIK